MPPKPWETRNRTFEINSGPQSQNISEIIASNPTQKDDILKQPAGVTGP